MVTITKIRHKSRYWQDLHEGQLCRYCFYPWADFCFFFCPAEATRCMDQGEIWQGGGLLLPAKFHVDRFRGVDLWPGKLKILEFYRYNCP